MKGNKYVRTNEALIHSSSFILAVVWGSYATSGGATHEEEGPPAASCRRETCSHGEWLPM